MCVGNVLMRVWLRVRVGLGGVQGRQAEQTKGGFCRIAVHQTHGCTEKNGRMGGLRGLVVVESADGGTVFLVAVAVIGGSSRSMSPRCADRFLGSDCEIPLSSTSSTASRPENESGKRQVGLRVIRASSPLCSLPPKHRPTKGSIQAPTQPDPARSTA